MIHNTLKHTPLFKVKYVPIFDGNIKPRTIPEDEGVEHIGRAIIASQLITAITIAVICAIILRNVSLRRKVEP